jgi:hypothetical protein
VGEVGIHLTDEIQIRHSHGFAQPVDVRPAQPAPSGPVHHLDAARIVRRERVGNLPRAIR